MRTILKLSLFILSNFGYWEYFREKHKISMYFAPVYTIAVQFSLLFAAGILNGLEEMTFVLYGLGLLLCARCLYQTKLCCLLRYRDWGYAYFAGFCALAAALVYGARFGHIDNFTHWATVVRSMLYTHRFPNFKDIAVTFTTYPLGTAAYIYYFCRLTHDGEWFQMLAQGYMILSTLLPIFAFARKNKLLNALLLGAMTLFLLQYNVLLTDLRVDTVMSLAGMAAIVFAYSHCASTRGECSVWYVFPMLLWVMNIKHAALLYVVIALLVLLPVRGSPQQKKQWLLLGGGLLLCRKIWSLHCDYVYHTDDAGMHNMSVDWFRYVLDGKTSEDIQRMIRGFWSYVTTERSYFWFLAWLVLLTVMILLFAGEERRKYGTLLLGAAGLYVVYTAGVLGMYVFSMPWWEGLSGAERYMRSGDAAVYYLFTVCAVMLLSRINCRKRSAAAAAAVILLTLSGWHMQRIRQPEYCSEEDRQMIERPIEENGFALGKSYLLCISADMQRSWGDHCRYIWQYNLLTDHVDQIVVTDAGQLEIEKNYDYVVILDGDNPVIRQWIQENYPDREEDMLVQHYL